MSDLSESLDAARRAGPGERIGFRDRIAAHGADAIPSLSEWVADSRLGPFAVRTLEKIAGEPANRRAVLGVLASADLTRVPEPLGRDIADAIARIGGRTVRAVESTGRAERPAVVAWPDSRDVSALELRFHDDMLAIFRRAGEATRRIRPDGSTVRGYWASYFLRGVRNHGGPNYARQLLHMQGTTPGFERLRLEGRLDLTVEALALRPEYVGLFTEDERSVAAHRLAEAGYMPTRTE